MWKVFQWFSDLFESLYKWFDDRANDAWRVKCVRCGKWAVNGIMNCADGWACRTCWTDEEYDSTIGSNSEEI